MPSQRDVQNRAITQYTFLGLMCLMGLAMVLFGCIWDAAVARYISGGGAANPKQIQDAYGLNIGLGIALGVPTFAVAFTQLWRPGSRLGNCHCCVALFLLGFGIAMVCSTNAGGGFYSDKYELSNETISMIETMPANISSELGYTKADRVLTALNREANTGKSHKFLFSNEDIHNGFGNLFVSYEGGPSMYCSQPGVASNFGGDFDYDANHPGRLYCPWKSFNSTPEVCAANAAMCHVAVRTKLLHYQWIAGVVWLCFGCAIIFVIIVNTWYGFYSVFKKQPKKRGYGANDGSEQERESFANSAASNPGSVQV